jgi:spoIIIJ-associated protein
VKEIEIIAATPEEALQRAAEQLGWPLEQLQMEILEEKSVGGLLGILAQKQVRARIRVIETETPEAESEEEPSAIEDVTMAEVIRPGEREDRATEAIHVLQTILDLMGLDAEVLLREDTDEEILLEIIGPDLGIVIGSFGQTLNALQLITNIMVNRDRPTRKRIAVDAEGYRERRRRSLENLAISSARRAKELKQEVVLEDLRAAERRIIHTTLQHDPDVVTFSEGEEPHRRLIISPRS